MNLKTHHGVRGTQSSEYHDECGGEVYHLEGGPICSKCGATDRTALEVLEPLRSSIFGQASALYSAAMSSFPFGEKPHGSNINYPETELGTAQRDAEAARQAYYQAYHLFHFAMILRSLAELADWTALAPTLGAEAERLRTIAERAGDQASNAATRANITTNRTQH
jgi:hypothetical protein